MYLILIVDTLGLIVNFQAYPYDGFTVFLMIMESLILIILLPKALKIGKPLKFLQLENDHFTVRNGIFMQKAYPLAQIKEVTYEYRRNFPSLIHITLKDNKKLSHKFAIQKQNEKDQAKLDAFLEQVNLRSSVLQTLDVVKT